MVTESASAFDIPQANSLSCLVDVVRALRGQVRDSVDLAKSLGFKMRHLHYYLHASEVLGFAQRLGGGDWCLLRAGENLAAAGARDEERRILTRAAYSADICRRAIRFLASFPAPGATRDDVARFLGDGVEISQTTLTRRTHTVLGWLMKLGLLSRADGYHSLDTSALSAAGVALGDGKYAKIVEGGAGVEVYVEYSFDRERAAMELGYPMSSLGGLVDGRVCRMVSCSQMCDAIALVELLGCSLCGDVDAVGCAE